MKTELRFPVRTEVGHYYEISVKMTSIHPDDDFQFRQKELENIVRDFKEGMRLVVKARR